MASDAHRGVAMNIRRIAGLPLVHFMAIGLALFAFRGSESRVHSRPPIVTPLLRGAGPTLSENARWPAQSARGEEELDDEILFREGLWRGLDRADPVVRARLVRDYRFAFPDAGDSAEVLREALALGLQRSDPVVRRRVTDLMRRTLVASGRDEPPSGRAIERYYATHLEQLRDPARFRITQVLLGAPPDAAEAFPLAPRSGLATERELARAFGAEFAERVVRLEPGRWSGPIPSVYGRHRVRLEERRDARLRPLSEMRSRIAARLREARDQLRSREALQRLREAWGIPRASAPRVKP